MSHSLRLLLLMSMFHFLTLKFGRVVRVPTSSMEISIFVPPCDYTKSVTQSFLFLSCFLAYETSTSVPSTTLSDGKWGGRHTFQFFQLAKECCNLLGFKTPFRPERDLNSDYATGAVLYQLKSKVNWELVILWVIESPCKMKLDAQYICNPCIY